ncbi:MAG: hypothetical protein UT09_C0008G0004 [Parcubacteria group bacterium GW2011_GWF2_38_8]|nr:MAG: hypothetical protein UT09_C0008G0004 [Parcubacteria group bacterium GW2011_GWF2_38_8]
MTKLQEEDTKTIEIIYDQQLVDDIVYKGLAKKEVAGDLELYKEYHERRDAIYELEQEKRAKRFKELDNDFFNRLGYDVYVREVFDEYPDIEEIIEEVHVRRATTRQNEGSNVVDEGRKVIIRLYPELFIEGKEIRRVIRHELMHVSDMMNSKFEYNVNEEFSNSPMEDRLIRDRYRLFWDISVDILGRNRKSRTIYLKPRDYSLNFKIGFLRGFMDSDGHISNKKIQFSSASQRIMDKTMSFLLECGFIDMNYYFYEEKRKNRVGMYHIALNKSERMNFFRRVQPRNLRKLNAPAGI